MEQSLRQALRQFTGADHRAGVPSPMDSGGELVVCLNPSRRLLGTIMDRGYTHVHRFVILPSARDARWLLPIASNGVALAATQIYAPYRPLAKILKRFATTALASGLTGWLHTRLLVASAKPLPLESLLSDLTGERKPVFAFSLGTPCAFRKLAVQVMRENGEVLGYVKMPMTAAAVDRLRHEASVLARLWESPRMRPHIPKLLYAGEWAGGYLLFQSSGPEELGPDQFGPMHEDFLSQLHTVQPAHMPGGMLVEKVAACWRKAEPSLASGWRALGQAALAKARRELDGVMVPCGVAHGDFAPWNTRVGDGRLYVFDWESASWEAPTSWDIFHFKTQVATLLNKKNDLHISWERGSGERASFLLYLLSSACQFFFEESPAQDLGLECRRQLLAKQLGGF